MKQLFWTGVILTAGLATTAAPAFAQDAGGPGAGQAGGQGRRGGGGGGFGGGQQVQGTVTAATADKLTIQTDAGDTYTVSVSGTTRVTKDRQAIKATDVKVGDGVTAFGTIDATAKTVTAMMVMDVDAVTMKAAKEDMGKTYITGKITALDLDALKITVMRTDNVSQVITVDDSTSFQRGARGITVPSMMGGMGAGGAGGRGGQAAGAAAPAAPESITMADVKVGDTIVATGAVKAGVFTPAKMGVSEPLAGGAQRRRPGAAPGATPDGQTGGAPPATPPPPQ
jgi:hypothetical protein